MAGSITCKTCGELTPHRGTNTRYCPPCAKAADKASRSKAHRAWRDRNPGEMKRRSAEWYRTERGQEWHFRARLRRDYGMTLEEFRELESEQKGACAICRETPDPNAHKRMAILHVDHDHVTGQVRGLLCQACNTGIGKLGDSPERLEAAAGYIRSRRSFKVVA